jgi:phenylalanyl-tRNA synthetase beta chain
MKVPLSWLKDFVEIDLPIEELVHKLTMAGLEVEEVLYVGPSVPDDNLEGQSMDNHRPETKVSGIEWAPDKIVVAAVHEVMAHPNADRLVLCRLEDGEEEHIVLTGAPNLYPYKGQGKLEPPLKVPYAREGARIFDGHQPGQVLTMLKRAKIRGVESYSMICSEKELGISEDHEGVIILDGDAPVGVPLVDYMGDVVFDIAITPNIARDANILGVAREVAAITGEQFKMPDFEVEALGPPIEGMVTIEIQQPELNPRFVFGLVKDVKLGPSPYWVQRRLHLAGMRPINNLVDATNYVMLEVGEPLHAFDYDILIKRAGGKAPKIITRRARQGEQLTTLDDVERTLDDFSVLVCDQSGPLAMAGVMGGAESEINAETRNVLLEGAAWNMINTRRTVLSQKLPSEAAYRFSRGVHPAMASRGVKRGLEMMRRWADGIVYKGLVDNYPLPPKASIVEVTPDDVRRWLGIDLTPEEIVSILERLEFGAEMHGQTVRAVSPDHRLDIGEGVIGLADVLEEIARVYGYENIPETRMADELPPQRGNPGLEREERIRDLLVNLGLQEVVTYRMTSPEREATLVPPAAKQDERPYVKIANPTVVDRNVLRHTLIAGLLEVIERNVRLRERILIFEIGPVFLSTPDEELPLEKPLLAIALSGAREMAAWQGADTSAMDFYDLKGILVTLLDGLHIEEARYLPVEAAPFHPAKCASLMLGERELGVMGELHPLVRERYELPETPLVAAELDLQVLMDAIPERYPVQPVSAYPPVLEDLAVIVDEEVPAERVAALLRDTGGRMLIEVGLFDVYRGEQVGRGKKSLAYSLVYQAADRTLTDEEVLKIRQRIVRQLDRELGAYLRT